MFSDLLSIDATKAKNTSDLDWILALIGAQDPDNALQATISHLAVLYLNLSFVINENIDFEDTLIHNLLHLPSSLRLARENLLNACHSDFLFTLLLSFK